MLFQLGNKIFEGQFAPESWSYSGNEANLSQYDLINTKPRLQLTGETLAELSFHFNLRVDFCNLKQEIEDLERWKSNGEILPLLLGNGEYVNDFVIKSVSKTILQTFDDGTPIEINVSLSLLECVTNKASQQRDTDKKNAKAVGDKSQIDRRPKQPKTPEAEAHAALMEAQIKAWEAAELAQQTKEASNPETMFGKVKNSIQEAQKQMDKAKEYVGEVQQQINNATGIISSIVQAKDKLTEIGSLMQPPFSLNNVNNSILNLQSAIRGIDTNSTVFTQDIILRKI